MQTKNRKLSNLLIDRRLQFRIIFTGALYMLAVCIITTGVVQFPLIYDMVFAADLTTQYRAAQSFLLVANKLLPAMGAVFVFFFLHQIVVTHRVCGPFVNFARTFRLMGQGDLTRRIKLRKGDYLHKEGDEINQMQDSLARLLSVVKSHADSIHAKMEEMTSAQEKKGAQEIRSGIKELGDEIRHLEERLKEFKLPST